MSLCLAGICKSGSAIALVFDERLSTNESLADVLTKGARIAPLWALLFAGDNIRSVHSVYDRLRRRLVHQKALSVATVQDEILKAQSQVFLEEIAPRLLPVGVTLQEFKRNPSSVPNHEQIAADMAFARRGYDFLLAGFDDRGLAHVVELPADAEAVHCRWGYGELGSGYKMAAHYLKFCKYSRDLSAREAAFHLCAAKFFSESGSVGPTTQIRLLAKDGTRTTMRSAPVRQLWQREGRPRVPEKLLSKMPKFEIATSSGMRVVRLVRKRRSQSSTGDR
jgi:hypothetical protein